MRYCLYAEACLRMQEADDSAFDLRNLSRREYESKTKMVSGQRLGQGDDDSAQEQTPTWSLHDRARSGK